MGPIRENGKYITRPGQFDKNGSRSSSTELFQPCTITIMSLTEGAMDVRISITQWKSFFDLVWYGVPFGLSHIP